MFRKKRKTKCVRTKVKEAAWQWFTKFIKLRDAVEDKIDPFLKYTRCRTCGKITERGTKNCQAGHFIGRGSGGHSGVYWAEENVHVQCSQCNAFEQGKPKEYEEYMLRKYGKETVDLLRIKHKINSYSTESIVALGIYYKVQYEELKNLYDIKE